jgi:hypothetical protein
MSDDGVGERGLGIEPKPPTAISRPGHTTLPQSRSAPGLLRRREGEEDRMT